RLRRGAPLVRVVPGRLAARRSRRVVRRASGPALDAARRHHRAWPRRGEREPHLPFAAARHRAPRSLVLGRHEAARHPPAAAVEWPVIALLVVTLGFAAGPSEVIF